MVINLRVINHQDHFINQVVNLLRYHYHNHNLIPLSTIILNLIIKSFENWLTKIKYQKIGNILLNSLFFCFFSFNTFKNFLSYYMDFKKLSNETRFLSLGITLSTFAMLYCIIT
jgi:hypothetical protein